jgi:hypothetical protein
MMHKFRMLAVLTIFVVTQTSYAGGPLIVGGSNGNTPLRYAPASVNLNFDIGTFGARTNAAADALVLQSFALWNNNPTSTIVLNQGTDLAQDIDASNYQALLPNGTDNDPSIGDGLVPVVYDDDGLIIEEILGVGQSDNIAGFAASAIFEGANTYIEDGGYIVLNGKLNLTDSDIVVLVTHEAGHLIGLDHSQLNINNQESSSSSPLFCSSKAQIDYPVMYPFLCRVGTINNGLHSDDIAAVSALYPVSNINQQFGQLNGQLLDTNGDPVLGANIWAINILDNSVYSIVSDYLLQGTGFFSLYLPAGTYQLHANAINTFFHTASGVGPYARNQMDLSFVNPIATVDFEGDAQAGIASILITTGAAVSVTFITDGTGSSSAGSIVNVLGSTTGGGSGGALSIWFMSLLICQLLWLRPRACTPAALTD